MRKFEKISFEEFQEATGLTKEDYENYSIPKRGTKYSAGYDFELLESFDLKPGETKIVPTGIKAMMNDDEVLFLIIRSSLGFKYNIKVSNQVGVIDKDYYDTKDTEGHIFVKLQNDGSELKHFEKHEHFVQGIFMKYLTTDDENEISSERTGGLGSTNQGEENDW